ncbi:MAG: tetratricopeptide repeat protein [Microcoleus sp. PH2017_29_MFU_D_A]|uniref:tetratricopeptide repeat protein n=1 Tax=unclassified Microcoleus TaxID=2642155 RepID=UPI001D4796A4|nr:MULTISPECIES: tetratricopeptide repeat protein [unclassified Microcoleus]MCC3417273.1 tetratricopeptide repeat protein [Microcoleus sp. PH2017_07_MST_O_A]MCC3512812.1 tetratricopeptide repeat protein [Microcoleus sp. PH2017_17_BER_D_A]TAG68400.1 MAG: outer membrane protein assembly factor BamD [Oscillatoriales cyanobacterium]MCC3427145.1 tetratricopeptide repeat protein [Microcoleus sp. PH2017_01_SCD_O_A]MCC3456422.1 tetratricopeptide repeat protein [Microcoleus sp. PH2017_08_TRC_O_A]
MKNKLVITLLLLSTSLSVVLTGCDLSSNSQNNSSLNNNSQNNRSPIKATEWNEVKVIMKKAEINAEDLQKISRYDSSQISDNKIEEIIDIYNSSKNPEIRKEILNIVDRNLYNLKKGNNFKKLLLLYQNIIKTDDKNLTPIALRGLVFAEGDSESPKWQDWSWSKELVILLEEAVNKKLYNLSAFGYYEQLALANKYPNSLFTKGCREYMKFSGETYFPGNQDIKIVFRQPFIPQIEINSWKNFVNKYPGHPGSNDALYRLARAYEVQGDYENAIIYYYESSEAPDGLFKDVARGRILFIIDLLMSSELLAKFLTNHPNHPLTPYIKYSKAVHLIREYKYSLVESELEDFLKNYQDGKYPHLVRSFSEDYLGAIFWTKVKEQLDQVKKLAKIRNQQPSDKNLYEEAKLWIDEHQIDDGFTAYNYLWTGNLRRKHYTFVPPKWEGIITYNAKTVTADFIDKTNKNYKLQISYLRSIKLFEQLLEQYPKSELVEKAKYSIALNYYYLWGREYPTFSENTTSWEDQAVKSFEEFITEFPNSSMVDDALYTIAYIKIRNESNDSQKVAEEALQKLLKNYPNSKIKKQAEELIKQIVYKP